MKGTFITLVLGVVAGILLAPGKGSDTLARLKEHFDGYKNDNLGEDAQWANESSGDGEVNETNYASANI